MNGGCQQGTTVTVYSQNVLDAWVGSCISAYDYIKEGWPGSTSSLCTNVKKTAILHFYCHSMCSSDLGWSCCNKPRPHIWPQTHPLHFLCCQAAWVLTPRTVTRKKLLHVYLSPVFLHSLFMLSDYVIHIHASLPVSLFLISLVILFFSSNKAAFWV